MTFIWIRYHLKDNQREGVFKSIHTLYYDLSFVDLIIDILFQS